MSGNRKQYQVKPDLGDEVKAESHTHRETNVTAPVLDSTRHYAQRRTISLIPKKAKKKRKIVTSDFDK